MKFIAYNPKTGEKLKLTECRINDRTQGTKYYFNDGYGNFVYSLKDKQLFELGHYRSVMEVMIAKKDYYLIGEY
jgi:S-adenosylmethionine hydrolase